MKKNKINKYQENKSRIREKALEFKLNFGEKNYSYYELSKITNYFEKQGRRYGLLKEFKENCII